MDSRFGQRSKGLSLDKDALKLSLVERIIWAWVLTLPAAGIVAYLMVKLFQLIGWIS